ncbi:GNAT family N-acetyltransferase [candidate division KSB1 bacterium]|nr:GNAT family N-acetyltransferase [candidate division KSB1 bacterium]
MNISEIKTQRLALRPFTLADVDEIHQLWIEPGVRKYLWDDEIIPKVRAQEVIAKSIELFNDKGFGLWAVTFHEQSTIIGFCGYWYFHEPPELEILYGISPEYWGNNLATEAARAMLQFGFQYLGFDKIIASADAPNAASFRVMEKTGMNFLKRENKNGLDTIFYSISKNDFQFDKSVQVIANEVDEQK